MRIKISNNDGKDVIEIDETQLKRLKEKGWKVFNGKNKTEQTKKPAQASAS